MAADGILGGGIVALKRRNTDEVVLCWSSWCHNFGVSEALNQECESSGVPKGFSRGSIFKHLFASKQALRTRSDRKFDKVEKIENS